MATQKILSTRIITKNAEYAALSTSEYVLKEGEIILGKVTVSEGNITAPAFVAKVGNGGAAKDAAWMYAKAVDVYAWAKKANLDIVDIPTLDLDAAAVAPIKNAIGALEGRMDTAEGEIDALQTAVEALQGSGEGSVAALIATALAEAKAYTDTAIKALRGEDAEDKTVKGAYEAAAEAKKAAEDEQTRATGIEAGLDSRLQTAETAIGVINGEEAGSIKKAEADAKAYAEEKASAAETAAKAHADTAAGTAETNAKAHADGLNTAMDGRMSAAEGKITTAEGKIAGIQSKLDNVSNVMDFVGAVTAKPAVEGYQNGDVIVVTAGDDAGKEFVLSDGEWIEFGYADGNTAALAALDTRMGTAEDDIDALEGRMDTAESEISTIKGDYLKSTDKTELTGAIATAKQEAIDAAASDATTKANQALADAKTWVGEQAFAKASDLTALDGRVSTAESEIDALQAEFAAGGKVTDVITRMGTAESEIDNLQAEFAEGGRVAAAEGKISALEIAVGDDNSGLVKGLADANTAISGVDGRVQAVEGKYLHFGENSAAGIAPIFAGNEEVTLIFDCGGLE